mmetsp:Transcript_10673/g.12873  ORF Transcript_10673/g.12873 Transcript_10673/m.12873 type:complete len:591 (+) Transcript_10673:20-1792(+)
MSAKVNISSLPRPEICLRSREEGVTLAAGPVRDEAGNLTNEFDSIVNDYDGLSEAVLTAKSSIYSENGEILGILSDSSVKLYSNSERKLKLEVNEPSVRVIALSPLGSFVLTWKKHEKGSENGNMIVWRIADGEKVFQVFERNYAEDTWPAVKWTSNEEIAGHMVKNAVHLYKGQAMEEGIIRKIQFDRVSSFSLASTPGPECNDFPFRIAVFRGEQKGKPAQASLFNHPGGETAVRTKSFFRAESASFLWAPQGNAVLVKTETSVDVTGASYYGESSVYLMRADVDYDCKIVMKKEGNFQDVAWSPKGKEFVAIAGSMPALAVLFNLKGDPVFQFGEVHRNTIRWSPQGRFLCLGGFGNLSGDMDFWDINKKKIMGSNKANCAVDFSWSPDGRHFMTATLSPRMKVDNGITMYTYYGDKVFEKSYSELYSAKWRPRTADVYPDRPQSPRLKSLNKEREGKPKAFVPYRPPGAPRSRAAERFRAEREGSGPKKIASTGPVISKAAARRQRKKLAEAAKAAEAEGKTAAEAQNQPVSKYSESEKKLRKLKKQLKAIVEIEKKLQSGVELNEQQKDKLSKKSEIETQIQELS